MVRVGPEAVEVLEFEVVPGTRQHPRVLLRLGFRFQISGVGFQISGFGFHISKLSF